jgi:hypothetical protein
MMIQNAFEFSNVQELRRRLESALETGKRNLTGAEYQQWEPSMKRKLQEIDGAVEDFFVRQAFGVRQTTSTVVFAKYFSQASVTVAVHTNVISGGTGPVNLLTGASPESVAPCLPFTGCPLATTI